MVPMIFTPPRWSRIFLWYVTRGMASFKRRGEARIAFNAVGYLTYGRIGFPQSRWIR